MRKVDYEKVQIDENKVCSCAQASCLKIAAKNSKTNLGALYFEYKIFAPNAKRGITFGLNFQQCKFFQLFVVEFCDPQVSMIHHE